MIHVAPLFFLSVVLRTNLLMRPTMAASDFSRLYIIGFDFRLLSVAAPHDSVAA